MSITTDLRPTPYTDTTASMQTDPEARHTGGAASESYLHRFPIEEARCATSSPDDVEWVPNREAAVVPSEMAALCRRCPARQTCLLWALAGDESGYWAGTTTADRQQMRQLGNSSVGTGDWLQERAARENPAGEPMHPLGEGSDRWYRAKCRCTECRAANSKRRADDRAKAKMRAAA